MDSESKIIDKTLQIHKVERCQMKGVYYLKFYFLSNQEKPFHVQWYPNGRDMVICGQEDSRVNDSVCASCFVAYVVGEEWIQCPGLCEQLFHDKYFDE